MVEICGGCRCIGICLCCYPSVPDERDAVFLLVPALAKACSFPPPSESSQIKITFGKAVTLPHSSPYWMMDSSSHQSHSVTASGIQPHSPRIDVLNQVSGAFPQSHQGSGKTKSRVALPSVCYLPTLLSDNLYSTSQNPLWMGRRETQRLRLKKEIKLKRA